jgi:uncharacterized membrane protein affecting hemolysin expression
MDIKKIALLILSVLLIGLIIYTFLLYGKVNNISNQNNSLTEENKTLRSIIVQDSINVQFKLKQNESNTIIKYITKEITKDSIIFFNSNSSLKEKLFSDHTNNY